MRPFLYSAIFVILLGCTGEKKPDTSGDNKLHSGILHENMDTLVNPGDDFYRYVNGNWLKNAQIPDDEPAYGVWDLVTETVNSRVKEIVERCSQGGYEVGSDEQLVGDLFASIMDMQTRNEQGLNPLKNDLAKIDSIQNHDDLASYLGFASRNFGRLPLRIYIYPDIIDSDTYNVHLSQHGLGMPDREYYLADDEHFESIREKYRELIQEIFTKANIANPAAAAETVYTIEYKLAEKQMRKEETRDYTKLHNIYATDQLGELLPDFNWKNYLDGAGLAGRDSIVVQMIDYTRSLNNILMTTPIDDWKVYLKWCHIERYGDRLSEELYTTFFNFYGQELYGTEAERPQWEKALNFINEYLGELVVKLYGQKYVSAEAIAEVNEMIDEIKQAYRVGIGDLDWMSPETKEQALQKLSQLSTTVVYPKKMRDFSDLIIKKDDYYGNAKRLDEFYYDYYLSHLDMPVDKEVYGIDLFSGSYTNSNNNLNIGAVFLQPPFFDETAENAVNYAGVGSVIGHEIGHAFDDKGRKFDGEGNLVDWWNESDRKEFERLSQILIDQFNQYKVLDTLPVNGDFTEGENLADLTSVVIPLKAYQLSLNGEEGPVIDNFTATQRFFISYGQVWMEKPREEYLRNQIANDPHAPNHLRVNGIVRNVPEFYTAFEIQESDSLYLEPGERLKIW